VSFSDELLKQRKHVGMSQSELARRIGVTQSTISDYESGRDVPSENAFRMTRVLESDRLLAEYSFEYKTGFFNVPVLNRVDDHSIVGMGVLIEEAAELISSIERMRKLVVNKRDRREFTKEEWQKLLVHEEQIIDIMPAIQMHLIKMSEVFGLDLQDLERRLELKMSMKGYYKKS
jgi:transcriptional regulator with XRE-family HTH domain